MKTNFSMKYTHLLMAAVTLLAGLFVSTPAQAAESDRALKQGDTIVVSYTRTTILGRYTYYVKGNANGTVTSTQTLDADCLWVLHTMTGTPSAVGRENNAKVTAQHLTTGKAFYMQAAKNGTVSLKDGKVESNYTTIYTIKNSQGFGEFVEGNILTKSGKTNYYLNWNNGWASSTTSSPQTMRIQKWSKYEVHEAQPSFLPGSAVFGWAETAAEADEQGVDVTCSVKIRTAGYYYNVSNPDQRIVYDDPKEQDPDSNTTHFAWMLPDPSDHNKQASGQMEFTEPVYNPGDELWHFTVKPIGPSPVVTDTAHGVFKDIFDNIVCTAKFKGVPASGYMLCERRTYWKKDLDPLTFQVSHTSYRFPKEGGNLILEPILWYHEGTEWYNTDGIVEHSVFPHDPHRVVYAEEGLQVTTTVPQDGWLSFTGYSALGIHYHAETNSANNSRSAQTVIHVYYGVYALAEDGYVGDKYKLVDNPDKGEDPKTGNYYQKYVQDNENGTFKLVNSGEFTRQITLTQAGMMEGAKINFVTVAGHGAKNSMDKDSKDRQKVHTNKKVMYYKSGEEVELRPAETSFYSYRRWYNYDTGKGIQNNIEAKDNTTWVDAPHVTVTSGRTTTSYNFTPINTDTDHSCGVFAVARSGSTASGYKLLYDGMNCPSPIIKGYSDITGGPNRDGVHTIACDLSAYNDYHCEETNGELTSVTEPTLSYRMLFELHPAKEVADSIRNLKTGEYLEEYHYTAPVGVDVHLTTSQRYRTYRYHKSELGYYYWSGSTLTQIQGTSSTITWKKDGSKITTPTYSANTDNLIVNSRTAGTYTYTLEVTTSAGTIRLAKFTVKYVNKNTVGPSSVAIITNEEIKRKYVELAEINFNDGPKPGNNDNIISTRHLDWEDATFGFAYQNPNYTSSRPANKDLCYYGEYLLVNRWNPNSGYGWMDKSIENRGGKANGYMLFADGTLEPSMVACINTDAVICSGQQMYCSAWVANACPSGYGSGANPIFRFNVQGRNNIINGEDTTYTDWQDVSVFFAGELPKGSGWQQINFPLHAGSQSYDQTRVSVYNFATTNTGNDFFLDDIYLYATPLPLSAYQASTSCAGSDIAIVVKVDYKNVDDDLSNKDVFYQGWIDMKSPKTGNDTLFAIPNLADYKGIYMWGNTEYKDGTQDFGMIHIPAKDFVPSIATIYHSVQEFIDHLNTEGSRAGVFYIQQEDGHYAMYIAHLLEGREGGQYEVRMATNVDDLAHPLCAMSVRLPIYKETKITYGKNNEDLSAPVVDACPNVADEIRVTVTNRISGSAPGDPGTIEFVEGRADWLIGARFDSVYADTTYCRTHYHLQGQALIDARVNADTLFRRKYGYTREEVTTAIVYDMRREPYENHPNPNYDVSDYAFLDSTAFFTLKDYHIVKSLCESELLELYMTSRTVMLSPGDSIFLWVYPIVGTAIDEAGNKLAVCNQPQWVYFRSPKGKGDTQQIMNLSPIANEDKTPAQKLMNGSVRVSASKVNISFQIPLNDIQNALFGWDSLRVIDTNDPEIKAKLASSTLSMRYYTDKVYQSTNGVKVYLDGTTDPNPAYHSDTKDGSGWKYYKAGDLITFRPIDANYVEYLRDRRAKSAGVNGSTIFSPYSESDANWITKETTEHTGEYSQPGYQHVNTDTMRANYTYHLMTNLVTDEFDGELGGEIDGCQYGVAFFDVVVIPDLLIWRPQVSNDWGDDNNWHAIINGVEQACGFAPNEDASVIIPALDNPLLYPAVTGLNLYPMAYGYTPTACRNIYLQAGAHILGQEKLTYNKAYVDMSMLTNDWNLISAPLQGMYSGDFYVPHTGNYRSYENHENVVYTLDTYGKVNSVRNPNNDVLFNTAAIEGIRSADAAYVTYTRFFNSNVAVYHHSTGDGTHTASTGFVPTNGLDNLIAPGQGINALSFGPDDKGEHTPYDLRLPKTETQYAYYMDGEATEYKTPTISRANANKFAFTTTGEGDDAQMTITLTNEVASSFFLLGNPTMAYVDMGEFFKTNSDVLSGAFYYLHNGTWSAKTTTMEDFFLSPMEAILVETYGGTPQITINVVLKAGHLTLNDHSYVSGPSNAVVRPESNPEPEPQPAMRHAPKANSDSPMELLTITAFTDDAEGKAYLGKKEGTSLRYLQGEDACFISSGVETKDEVVTPMNIYTVRDSNTMMVDIRPAISRVPLGFVISDKMRRTNDSINICFNTNEHWGSELYFVDEKEHTETRLYDGMILTIATPANYEQRYFLLGTDEEWDDDPTIVTAIDPLAPGVDVIGSALDTPEKLLREGMLFIRRAGHTYNAQGALVK